MTAALVKASDQYEPVPKEALKDPSVLLKHLGEKGIEVVNLWTTDLFGKTMSLPVPTDDLKPSWENPSAEGDGYETGFDGSSLRGFQVIEESDMNLRPCVRSAVRLPFVAHPTVALICEILDPFKGEYLSLIHI